MHQRNGHTGRQNTLLDVQQQVMGARQEGLDWVHIMDFASMTQHNSPHSYAATRFITGIQVDMMFIIQRIPPNIQTLSYKVFAYVSMVFALDVLANR